MNPQPIFTYNQEQAVKAGNAQYINETGAYLCKILSAEYVQSQKGTLSLEFSVETQDGLKGNYISVYYQDKDGQPLQGGQNMIQAIMGCANVQQLTQRFDGNKAIAPELAGKYIGLFLQKVFRLKQDGTETYSFNIVCPFFVNDRKTLSERIENRPAERIQYLSEHMKDRDDRNKQSNQQGYAAQHQFYGQPQQPSVNNVPDVESENDPIPF
ncbi:hypothetical protein [Avibacterium paragallinarum]|uniref:hypothetical protein n=1 Tax=Avibacterium paragallinarum TaxID=728 RepID=UPI003985824F